MGGVLASGPVVAQADVPQLVLAGLRLILFALALGLTGISFIAYQNKRSDRLESAFIGFAFISMGVAVGALGTYAQRPTVFGIAESIPFIVGFSMLYLSLYR